MQSFGDVIRLLMERRGFTGRQLSAAIGISTTSVSKIVTGQSKPKQLTLTRLMKRLCTNAEEEQMVIRAFTGLMDTMPDEPVANDESNARENEERVRRFLEVKTQSILFKRSVAKELDKAGIAYVQDYCKGIISTDFFIEQKGKRIALECRFNVQRDLERAVVTAQVLSEGLQCNVVITVTPFEISESVPEGSRFVTATPSEVIELLAKLSLNY